MIKTILSDLGNVVVWYDDTKFVAALNAFRSGSPLESSFIGGSISSHFRAFCRGRIGAEAFRRRVLDACFSEEQGDKIPTKEEFFEAYAKVLTPNRPVLDLWSKLHGDGYVTTAVSDIDPLRHRECRDLGIFKPFDHAVLSYEEGEMKPSTNLLKTALIRSRCKPDEAIYVDDLEDNLHPARALGIPCHRYLCDNGLRKFLRAHGVRID